MCGCSRRCARERTSSARRCGSRPRPPTSSRSSAARRSISRLSSTRSSSSATRLCDADHSWLFLRDGNFFRWAASFGHGTEVHERIKAYFKPLEVPVDRGSITGRAALEGRLVHVPDVLADPDYTWSEAQHIGGYRAAIGVPLFREGTVIGVIFVAKCLPEPFSANQMELVTTFADQAVIAIENVRLFDEVQARTRELEEALEYQTATGDVLNVISRSPAQISAGSRHDRGNGSPALRSLRRSHPAAGRRLPFGRLAPRPNSGRLREVADLTRLGDRTGDRRLQADARRRS